MAIPLHEELRRHVRVTRMPKKPTLTPSIVGPTGAAQIAGVSRSRIYELLNSGEIPSRKDGRRRLIHRDDIEKWFSRLPPAPAPIRVPSEPPTGPLLPLEQQKIAMARAIEAEREPEPEPDWATVYTERCKLLRRNVSDSEAKARAFDFTVDRCRGHSGFDLEKAKALVRAALAKAATP
jgi:excisionase family DNA binding protein